MTTGRLTPAPWIRPDLVTIVTIDADDNPLWLTLPPRITTLGGRPRIMLDHELIVQILPAFGTPDALMSYDNGYDECRLPAAVA